jgi:hypothetical protein
MGNDSFNFKLIVVFNQHKFLAITIYSLSNERVCPSASVRIIGRKEINQRSDSHAELQGLFSMLVVPVYNTVTYC